MGITLIQGNVLDAKEDYILQQNCCTSLRASGLSMAIAKQFGVNPYKDRRPYAPRLNWACLEDRPSPGSILISGKIVCMFAQYCHGRPGQLQDPSSAQANGVKDTPAMRLAYFVRCLEAVSAIPNIQSVAIPHGIGCGLAGGDWIVYEKYIQKWSEKHPDIKVVLYKFLA